MAGREGARKRTRGSIEAQPSGALRVRVYAGYDPVSGARHYLTDMVPAGPKAEAAAERARIRLLNQVDERRNPKTTSTVDQLLDRYLDVVDIDESTMRTYRMYLDRHVRPILGRLSVARVDGEVLDSLYGQLRRCRSRCAGRGRQVDHRTSAEHTCDAKCRVHVCRPLAASTVRQIHWILSGAFDHALRWNWISVSPVRAAEPPPPPRPNPTPPTAEEAARIFTEAWTDPEWGTFVWLAMTTGARRGELCALRRSHLDANAGILTVPRSVSGSKKKIREKDTKTHQQRRVAIDAHTLRVIHRRVCRIRVR